MPDGHISGIDTPTQEDGQAAAMYKGRDCIHFHFELLILEVSMMNDELILLTLACVRSSFIILHVA
jgi:hypothetical protein